MPHDFISLALAGGVLAGCSGNSDNVEKKSDSATTEQKAEATDEIKAPESDVAMKYITPADAEANLDSSDYVFIDLRKADDYKAGHIKGAIAADMDACKGGDFQNGVDTMKAALKDATGFESGADMDNVFTLEGGMKAWTGATEA